MSGMAGAEAPAILSNEDAADLSDKRVTARMPGDLIDAMSRLARLHDRSLSGEIVRAMREYIQREEAALS